MRPLRSLRFRIAAAFVLGAVLVTGFVGLATYFGVSRTLTDQRKETALAQTERQVRTIETHLESIPTLPAASDIVEPVQRRAELVVIGPEGQSSASELGLNISSVPPELREVIQDGDAGVIERPTPHSVVVGTPIVPAGAGEEEGFEAYFFYSLASVDRTLSLIARVFIVVALLALVVAGFAGYQLAQRTVRPIRLAAEAADRMAEGDLDARLHVGGHDELSRLSAAFNQMAAALTERIARERRFVADVSHELRTPLTTLKTAIGFLHERLEEIPPKLQGPLGLAVEEVGSLQRLVDDLLELSRMEAGTVQISPDEVDLVAFAAQLARRRAPTADVRISGPERLIVHTDKMRLERVVGNLLENAVFHGGDSPVDILVQEYEGAPWIVVSDRGPGIEREKLNTIFDRFWRGDASRTRDGRVGAGLGLAIARENAVLIGAEIGVESEVGSGSRFGVKVPDLEEDG